MFKSVMLATALTVAATGAFAADFDNNELSVTASSGSLEFTVGTVGNELATIETGAYLYGAEVAGVEAYVLGSVGYDRLGDELSLGAEVGGVRAIDPLWTVYGSVTTTYATSSADLGAGEVSVAPSVGVSRNLGETASVFAETGYAWTATNAWDAEGGYVEVGASFGVAEGVLLTPSLVRTLDTGADETNAKLAVALAF